MKNYADLKRMTSLKPEWNRQPEICSFEPWAPIYIFKKKDLLKRFESMLPAF